MKVLVTGACGFVGSTIAMSLAQHSSEWKIVGLDNLIRRGSERNIARLQAHGITFIHGDTRSQSDLDGLAPVDYVIDAAANASVTAGLAGYSASRQLMEHNLLGTINLLEKCRRDQAGFILLSTSRVYSIPAIQQLPLQLTDRGYQLDVSQAVPSGVTPRGVNEDFSTAPPVSLYGASKLASETLALEYGEMGDFPVWVNRCGLMAGAGQFGHALQGIVAFWIRSHFQRRGLRFIGFEGDGRQVRDCLHPLDLAELLIKQMILPHSEPTPRILNVSGGLDSAFSLRQLADWCGQRFGPHPIQREPETRPYDVPWLVLDSQRAQACWDWAPSRRLLEIFEEIALEVEQD